jgi:predicted GNAT family acetyltransferase
MIRIANKFDKPEIIEMLRMFRSESNIEQYRNLDNEDYINNLLDQILGGLGIIYIEQGKGMIIGLIAPVIWCNKHYALHELAWYVKPEYRNTSIAYRLVKAYIEFGNQLKENKRVILFTLSKLPDTPSLNYEKLGFKKIDENWMQ